MKQAYTHSTLHRIVFENPSNFSSHATYNNRKFEYRNKVLTSLPGTFLGAKIDKKTSVDYRTKNLFLSILLWSGIYSNVAEQCIPSCNRLCLCPFVWVTSMGKTSQSCHPNHNRVEKHQFPRHIHQDFRCYREDIQDVINRPS